MTTSRRHIESTHYSNSVFCFDSSQAIHKYQTTFMIRRDFRFLLQFNDLLNKLIQGGFLNKWQQNYRYTRTSFQNEYSKPGFRGIFLLFGLGMIFNIGIGIFEQIVHRKCCREHAHPNWKFIEKAIDGKRHYLILK